MHKYLQLPRAELETLKLMAEAVTLQLSGQQAALLAPILQQICGGDGNQEATAQVTPQRSLQRLTGFESLTPSSSESTSSSGSPPGGDCVFSLDDLLNPKKRGTKGSEAQNYMNVSDIVHA